MKKFLCLLSVVAVVLLFSLTVFGEEISKEASAEAVSKIYVVDLAQVLDDDELAKLNDRLSRFSQEHKFDLVVLTTVGVAQNERMQIADDFFDKYGYGYGKNYDGAVLLVNVNSNGSYTQGNSWISTSGKGISLLNDEKIQEIGNKITPELRSTEFYSAFNEFVDLTEEAMKVTNLKNILVIVAAALIVGLIGAFGYTKTLKKQLETVDEARDANNYLVNDSLHIDDQRDTFLYFTVTKTPRADSKSGSSTHTSSSGRTHGGGGF